ncbi:hypothetical protein IscW_ISCW014632 [Ixodes scapularis]|uniref:Uncharacterized protein n=1 Tax=Ixodes scapularis TaxID=6945 RepID=B7QH29_IXOSC|nr:hypothetical protein IscW_ISCW014632 [Ixodes scapularis]|eukprot:XP_002414486.1 hypothetical protein IscW_ISCW014632 [Ixodes scapularis]
MSDTSSPAGLQVGDLAAYLRQQVRLNCCSETVTVRDCIPGPIKCPRCAAPAEFSWCADTLFHGPTNHCSKCMRCNLFAGAHCKKCNSCYYFGLGSNGCPKCEPSEQTPAEGPDLSKTEAILAQCAFPAQLRPSRVQRSGPRPLLPKPAQAPQQARSTVYLYKKNNNNNNGLLVIFDVMRVRPSCV